MRVLKLVATLCAMLTGAETLSAGRVVAIADADTIVSATHKNRNYGSQDSLRIGNEVTEFTEGGILESRQRGFIRFDLSSIPAQATVTDAALTAFVLDPQMVGEGLHLFEAVAPWEELTVNWFTRPGTGSAMGTLVVSANSFVSFVSANFTALVQAWVSGTRPNHGLELRFHDELLTVASGVVVGDVRVRGRIADSLASREHADELLRPRLIVDYVIPEPATLALFAGVIPWVMRRSRRPTPR